MDEVGAFRSEEQAVRTRRPRRARRGSCHHAPWQGRSLSWCRVAARPRDGMSARASNEARFASAPQRISAATSIGKNGSATAMKVGKCRVVLSMAPSRSRGCIVDEDATLRLSQPVHERTDRAWASHRCGAWRSPTLCSSTFARGRIETARRAQAIRSRTSQIDDRSGNLDACVDVYHSRSPDRFAL